MPRDGNELRVLRGSAELEALEPAWRRLWQSDPQATPFQSPDWLLPWWRQFGQSDLRAIAIAQNGELIGLLPFYIYPGPRSGTRQLLLLGAGTSDYLDGIFAPTCTPQQVRRALALIQHEQGWDTASIPQLRPCSKLLQALVPEVCPFPTESCSRMRAVTVAGLPRKIRQNVRYYGNRAARNGTLEFAIADESNALSFFDALVRLHTERWQSRGESGVLSDPRVLAWHRDAVPRMARSGLLRLCALRHNGENIAVMYGLIDPPGRADRTLYIYLPAFSTHHAELRPGTLLLAQAIESATNEGMQTIDMLRGNEDYKEIWHVEKTPTYGIELRPSAQASSQASSQRSTATLSEAA